MRVFREAKAWYCPIIVFIALFFICLLLRQSPNRRLLNVHHVRKISIVPFDFRLNESDNKTFAGVVKGASMPDRTIILSIVNKEQASPGSVLDLFFESFKIGIGTRHYLNHLVIVATDIQAFQYCKTVHPHCFHYTPVITISAADKLAQNRTRLDVLRQLVDLGYSFFYTDADVMWLRNPFQHVNPTKEMTFSCEFLIDEDSFKADMGLFYIKAADLSSEFFKYWKLAKVIYPSSPDSHIFKEIIELEVLYALRLGTKLISTVHYGGFCQPSNDISKISTWHANCCNNLEDKVHDLKLILDEWKNYTSSGSSSTSWPWKAPLRCLS